MEMSALVNYIQPTHFHSFELADSKSNIFICAKVIFYCVQNLFHLFYFLKSMRFFHFIESICC